MTSMLKTASLLAAVVALSACAGTGDPAKPVSIWQQVGYPTSSESEAILTCQDDLFTDGELYILPAFLARGYAPVDPYGNTPGLTLTGYMEFLKCMGRKGYQMKEGS